MLENKCVGENYGGYQEDDRDGFDNFDHQNPQIVTNLSHQHPDVTTISDDCDT